MPLFPDVEDESPTGLKGGDKVRWFSTPSPWGEGGAHAPGAGDIPVFTGNREDLAVPHIRRFAAPSPRGEGGVRQARSTPA
jgi:hypothetical protein